MPLYAIDSDAPVKRIPHCEDYDTWKSRLTTQELDAINARFDELIGRDVAAGREVFTSSWLPGELSSQGSHEWEWPFHAIWEKACNQSWEQTGFCFGLLVWEHMMNRVEDWCFIKSQDGEIEGTKYFLRRTR